MSNFSDPSTWTPAAAGESPQDIFNDRAELSATLLCGFGYGIAFTLYWMCAQALYAQLWQPEKRRRAALMLAYISAVMLCGVLYFASESRVLQLSYVDNRNYPGGPFAYLVLIFSSPIDVLGNVTYFIVNWLADAILIWRVYILYSSTAYARLIIILPSLLYLGSFSLGVVMLVRTSIPSQDMWSPQVESILLAYYSMTAALTIIATTLMTIRLLIARKKYITAMGNTSHARQYLSVVTMIVESSALYAIWSIIFICLYAVGHPMQSFFLVTLTDVSIIALLLIIFRVSRGTAWNTDTEQTMTTTGKWSAAARKSLKFAEPSFRMGTDPSLTRLEGSVTVDSLKFGAGDEKEEVRV